MNEFKARVEDEQEVLVPCLGERVNSGFVTSSAAQNLSLCPFPSLILGRHDVIHIIPAAPFFTLHFVPSERPWNEC